MKRAITIGRNTQPADETSDHTVSYDGGDFLISVDEFVHYWWIEWWRGGSYHVVLRNDSLAGPTTTHPEVLRCAGALRNIPEALSGKSVLELVRNH